MRITTTLGSIAAMALVAGAMLEPSQPHADTNPDQDVSGGASVEYRGELYPNPETGCIELPDEPGAPLRLWPYQGDPDVPGPRDATDDPEIHRFGDSLEDGPGRDQGIVRGPWPLCEDPEVSVVVTEDGFEISDAPEEPER